MDLKCRQMHLVLITFHEINQFLTNSIYHYDIFGTRLRELALNKRIIQLNITDKRRKNEEGEIYW